MQVFIATKEKMKSFYEEKVRGIIVRAQARWHEQGEKSSKLRKKKPRKKKRMRRLNLANVMITDRKVILFEQKRFYEELCTSSSKETYNNDIEAFWMNLNIPKLTD